MGLGLAQQAAGLGQAQLAAGLGLAQAVAGMGQAQLASILGALRLSDRNLSHPETVCKLKQVLETYTDTTRYPRCVGGGAVCVCGGGGG